MTLAALLVLSTLAYADRPPGYEPDEWMQVMLGCASGGVADSRIPECLARFRQRFPTRDHFEEDPSAGAVCPTGEVAIASCMERMLGHTLWPPKICEKVLNLKKIRLHWRLPWTGRRPWKSSWVIKTCCFK